MLESKFRDIILNKYDRKKREKKREISRVQARGMQRRSYFKVELYLSISSYLLKPLHPKDSRIERKRAKKEKGYKNK